MTPDPDEHARYVHGEREEWKVHCPELKVTQEERGPDGRATRWIWGNCPVCTHEIRKSITSWDTVELFDANGTQRVPDLPRARYLVTCNCVFAHSDAPEGVRGCGAQGGVVVTPTPDGRGTVSYCADMRVGERDADEWVEQAAAQRVSHVRQFAGQWATMLGVVTGFVAVGTIFDADKEVYGLTGDSRVGYIVLALLALAAAVVAVVFAMWASGLRKLDDVPAEADRRAMLQRATVAYCRRWLAASKWAALASVILLSVAMYLRFRG